ncbi:sugar kinase [Litoreibacter roseus]|uniref:Ketodeoxygluconokinase n=1 Tax=Litoreibacter roseus TaxID=2601869 RepID=A0A6N6JI37_9RHOB|nr:sugar kinase [Litoreibacter roseus]GFE65480.1 ketodeoxygluconokinase [Litoreibacter roseus]
MSVLCIGEAMVELSLEGDTAKIGIAGDTLNTAIYVARAGPKVSYLTRVGCDSFSDRMIQFMAEEGARTDLIERDPARTVGIYAIDVDPAGERSFSYWRGQSAARAMFAQDFDPAPLMSFDLVYLSAITLAILPEDARERLSAFLDTFPGWVAFDSNYRPALWEDAATAKRWVMRLWSQTDIALPSVDDEMALFGEDGAEAVIERLQGAGVINGALKQGAAGPVSLGESCEISFEAAPCVVDTTAAGDSFNGGYLGAYLTGADQAAALQAGHRQACKVIGYKGAIIPKTA